MTEENPQQETPTETPPVTPPNEAPPPPANSTPPPPPTPTPPATQNTNQNDPSIFDAINAIPERVANAVREAMPNLNTPPQQVANQGATKRTFADKWFGTNK